MSMHRVFGCFLVAIIVTLVSADADADSEIVIAIRYLRAAGTSHSHLYLYREDGKLLRQLTNDNSGQDVAPIFDLSGETIVFTREKPHKVIEFWAIKPRGEGLKKLDPAPSWYVEAKTSPYFTNLEPEEAASAEATTSPPESPSPEPMFPATYKSPDSSIQLGLRLDMNEEDDQTNGPGHGKHYLLRDLKAGTETEFGEVPGFYGATRLLHNNEDENQHFLFDESLRTAFFDLHLNSTDGDTVFALDLDGPRFVRLSPNWATPIPLPGESAFLTFTENRYIAIPRSTKTANCSYIERWDDTLNHIRYAREKSAALCYGMSMHRPGLTPAVITLRRSAD